ncbi:hypothetical protein AAFF_G00306530 [Aldrovandia affinis]|uniref:Uncharacterized protein n=1 Tax=Aldrovandia affinis TaxID=143900 RepID=A0AAD7R8L4_9TELE|nr:hypothetical protein AAFF_G00306530 [Aldrovandia affinis]
MTGGETVEERELKVTLRWKRLEETGRGELAGGKREDEEGLDLHPPLEPPFGGRVFRALSFMTRVRPHRSFSTGLHSLQLFSRIVLPTEKPTLTISNLTLLTSGGDDFGRPMLDFRTNSYQQCR